MEDYNINNEDVLSPVNKDLFFSSEDGLLSRSFSTEIIPIALLVTANTVGAGMIALPDVVSKPGMMNSIPLFVGIYVVNLISGLLIAEVCIKQQEEFVERGIGTVPSSFKEMAEEAYGGTLSNIISAISIFSNWCVLTFALTRAGVTLNGMLSGPTTISSEHLAFDYAAFLMLGNIMLPKEIFSKIASSAGIILFISFVVMAIPGFTHLFLDISSSIMTGNNFSGLLDEDKDFSASSLMSAAPTIVELMIFQNIVPTVTKLLGFSRSKTIVALAIGSGLPMIMFITYCYLVIGGLIDGTPSVGNPVVTMFMMSSVVGSTISGAISLSSEFTSILETAFSQKKIDTGNFSVNSDQATLGKITLAVFLSIFPPLAAGTLLGNGVSDALKCAGAYCAPLLYGVIPVLLAWNQREKNEELAKTTDYKVRKNVVPGGNLSLAGVSFFSMTLIGQTMFTDLSSLINGVSLAAANVDLVI